MPLITIATKDGKGQLIADVVGLWGIHHAPGYPFAQQRYQVTHVPTGFAFLGTYGASYERCVELIQRITNSALDFYFTDPAKMTPAIKSLGATLRDEFTEIDPELA